MGVDGISGIGYNSTSGLYVCKGTIMPAHWIRCTALFSLAKYKSTLVVDLQIGLALSQSTCSQASATIGPTVSAESLSDPLC